MYEFVGLQYMSSWVPGVVYASVHWYISFGAAEVSMHGGPTYRLAELPTCSMNPELD